MTLTGRLATVRMVRNIDGQSTILDLLFASSGIESEIVAGAKLQEIIPGLKLRVAEVPHLVAMKLLSFDPFRRGQDGTDVIELLKISTERGSFRN